jgi:hypothetical protein
MVTSGFEKKIPPSVWGGTSSRQRILRGKGSPECAGTDLLLKQNKSMIKILPPNTNLW